MPGQNGKCSSCDKPKKTTVIECSSCEQWLPYCCAGVSASDDVVEFECVPFYCTVANDCQQTGNRLAALKTQCYHCHSQTNSRREKTIRCLV